MELLIDLFVESFFGMLQAFVGIVWPSKDPQVLGLQRWTKWLVAMALIAVLVAVVMYYRAAGWAILMPIGVACLLMVIAGLCGHQIERRCRERGKSKSPPEQSRS